MAPSSEPPATQTLNDNGQQQTTLGRESGRGEMQPNALGHGAPAAHKVLGPAAPSPNAASHGVPHPGESNHDEVMFLYQDDGESWEMLDIDMIDKLNGSRDALVTVENLKKGRPIKYDIDLKAMTSTNSQSKTERKVRNATMRVMEWGVERAVVQAHVDAI